MKQNKNEILSIQPVESLKGEISLPGDKSIAHRAVIFGALAKGESLIRNFPDAQDPLTTLECMEKLGVEYEYAPPTLWIGGKGLFGVKEPKEPLNAKNSATTMRLLAGVLVGQPFNSVITGDESLLRRPMRRIIKPLKLMGAHISGTRQGTAPLKIKGKPNLLNSIHYEIPEPSAQVKSAILLAGLYANGTTVVVERLRTRDHTERMLALPIEQIGFRYEISVKGNTAVIPSMFEIPGDPSTAAFYIVAALITPNSHIVLKNISLNPTRIVYITILKKMNADIVIRNQRLVDSEPVGDIEVKSSRLKGNTISVSEIPLVIDELPVLAVAGAVAEGDLVVRNAAELRFKETDRIAATVKNLSKLGVFIIEHEDGFTVRDGKIKGGKVLDSFGDHRIAMASIVAGLAARKEVKISNHRVVDISYPKFMQSLQTLIHT